jgi:hypothetical protein
MTSNKEIPKKYKAAIYDKPGTISTKVVELDTPEPDTDEVLIRLTHSGVCHSDQAIMVSTLFRSASALTFVQFPLFSPVVYVTQTYKNSATFGHTSKKLSLDLLVVMRESALSRSSVLGTRIRL